MIPSLLAVASLALVPPGAVEVGAFARPGPEAAAFRTLAAISPTWDSPGLDASGSMPIGNGTLGANVWVEANGDLVLLVGHTDAFSECERLLKLGRVRISCDPPIDVTRGFTRSQPLTAAELAAVYPLAALRLCVNGCTWTARTATDPSEYGLSRMAFTWPVIRALAQVDPDEVQDRLLRTDAIISEEP